MNLTYTTMPLTREMSRTIYNISINVTGHCLTETEYGISVFALENCVPFPRVVTSPRTVIVLAASNDQGLQLQ